MQRSDMLVGLMAIGLVAVGCESSQPPMPPKAVLGESNVTDSAKQAPGHSELAIPVSADVSLEVRSWDETLALVADQKGKVVVLDLWSTSCDPCVKEFPHLVELHKKYGDGKVVCMSASCDFVGLKSKPPETYKPQVLAFLTEQGAKFPNILLNVEIDVLCEKIELASIPAIYVYGRDGRVAKRFDNDAGGAEFTYEKDVVPLVEKLIAE